MSDQPKTENDHTTEAPCDPQCGCPPGTTWLEHLEAHFLTDTPGGY